MASSRVSVAAIEGHLGGLALPLPSSREDTRERYERRAAAASGLLKELIRRLPKKRKPAAEPEVPAEAAAAAAAAPRMLAILGHGHETGLFEDRELIPPGITLVTITQHAGVAIMPHTCRATSLFSNDTAETRALLQDPYANREAISDIIYGPDRDKAQDFIHVYRSDLPANKYPQLHISPLADWSKRTASRQSYMAAFRSGIYRFPIALAAGDNFSPSMPEPLRTAIGNEHFYKTNSVECPSMVFYSENKWVTGDLIDKLFTGSLYPTEEAANAYIESSRHSVIEFQNKFEITLEKLFTQMGPGIYYYLICRDGHTGIADVFNNSWGFIFPEEERLRTTGGVDDFTIPGTYAYQILYFRGEYAGITDPIAKAMYYLNVLNGTQHISHPGPAVVDPFPLSDANFIRLALLLVSENEDLLPANFWIDPPSNTIPNRNAFENSSDWYMKAAKTVSAALETRLLSAGAQGVPAKRQRPLGGAGGGVGGARRNRSQRKTRRRSRRRNLTKTKRKMSRRNRI